MGMQADRRSYTRTWSSTWRLAMAGSLAFLPAWTRPALPLPVPESAPADLRLDFMVVKVNDETHVIRSGDELPVMWGDRIEVTGASLVDRQQPVGALSIIGFRNRPGQMRDDRGHALRSHQLHKRYSEQKRGEVYAILATTKGLLNGVSYLRLIDPVLRYAEVKVNGVPRLLRDGEALTLRASDQFKVEQVVTNLLNNKDVLFHIVPAAEAGRYQIRFERDQRAFANIPLKVME